MPIGKQSRWTLVRHAATKEIKPIWTRAMSARPRGRSAVCWVSDSGIVMTEHKFKIGQLVYFQPGSPDHARPGPYQIVRRLPESEGEFHYVIRSTYEDHERVAIESQLTRA